MPHFLRHLFLSASSILLLSACSGSDNPVNTVPVIDLAASASAPMTSGLSLSDVSYTPFDTTDVKAIFGNASIIDILGDTVILRDDSDYSRLLLFSLSDGRPLGQISHRGQGPGEYNTLYSAGIFAYPDRNAVLVTDMERASAYLYGLANDSLLHIYSHAPYFYMHTPVGSAAESISIGEQREDGFMIHQYDRGFSQIDSIMLTDTFLGSSLIKTSDSHPYIMLADTIYSVDKGSLGPALILSRADKTLTFENEREIMQKAMMTGESEKELFRPYILVRDVELTGNHIMIRTLFDGRIFTDIYRISDGTLLSRSETQVRSSIPVSLDSATVHAEQLFAKDGVWYGIVNTEEAAALAGKSVDETNSGIIRFRISD